jgi:hypothetical protein
MFGNVRTCREVPRRRRGCHSNTQTRESAADVKVADPSRGLTMYRVTL